jgi:peroxiredoxin
MNRVFTLVGLAALFVITGACSKADPNAPPKVGPELKPPATTDGAAPLETAPPVEEKLGATIGAPGPAWANLEGTDGKTHSLKDLSDAQVVAVVFTCNECPVAKAYEERMVKFADDYKDKGVTLVAINVNKGAADELPAMKTRAEERKFSFAYLKDPSQSIGRAYGAAVTPHAFVLDKNRNVVYIGPIEDNMDEAAVQKHALRDAVDAALAGKTPEVTTMTPHGCSINYD